MHRAQPISPSSLRNRLCRAIAALLCFCMPLLWASDSPADTKSLEFNHIERIVWRHNESAAQQIQEIARKREPVVIVGSPSADWPALSRWTSTSFWRVACRKGDGNDKKLEMRLQKRNPVANVDLKKDLTQIAVRASLVDESQFEDSSLVTRQCQLIWDDEQHTRTAYEELVAKSGSLFMYLTMELEKLNSSLLQDVAPYEFMFINESASSIAVDAHGNILSRISPGHGNPRIWLSKPLAPDTDIKVVMHYDTHHNFNVQVAGTKKFWLLPPSAWRSVAPNPVFHPSDRHSRLPLSEVSAILQQDTNGRQKLLQATLSSGEMLYIPPYYFHAVEAQFATKNSHSLEGAINVNAFSLSQEWSTMLTLSQGTSTLLRSMHGVASSKVGLLNVLSNFFKQAIPSVLGDTAQAPNNEAGAAFESFMTSVLKARWQPTDVSHTDSYLCDNFSADMCPTSQFCSVLTGPQRTAVTKAAEQVRNTLNPRRSVPCMESEVHCKKQKEVHAVRELMLADFLEGIAVAVLQSQACFFLQCMHALC